MDKIERPQDKYNREKTVRMSFRFVKTTERDIIQKLESVPNKAGYIKSLIRADIKKEVIKMTMKRIGTADCIFPSTGSRDVDVWESAEARRFCVSNWNGEMWCDCWEVFADMTTGPTFSARPVYRYDVEGIDPSTLEENSAEWERAVEIVGLDF